MDMSLIENNIIFKGMTKDEINKCLDELNAKEKTYKKGTILMHAGSVTNTMGIVLFGSVTIESNDIWGNCTVLSNIPAGGIFAETYAIKENEIMLVDVRANTDCKILFLTITPIIRTPASSNWSNILIKNLLLISTQKNLTLSKRSFHTSPKSARGRILSYLNTVSIQMHSPEFDIPFNRQQMADYLNLERTNMSKELGKMQKEHIIEFRKNHFKLLDFNSIDY